jgi:starch synthase
MQDPQPVDPAILFAPDGYRTDSQKLMGRQAAGQGFLRAAVQAAGGRTLHGYAPRAAAGREFIRLVGEIDPQASAAWLKPADVQRLQALGHLYMPGPTLGELARQRLRASPAAWSLTGVTHTTASHAAMDAIADLVAAPVMPWDALVCTSQAVLSTVKTVLKAQHEYLQWRFGAPLRFAQIQLPVIPLGVHCGDFEFSPERRIEARARLGIEDDAVVALFVGRLSFHAKAHPHAMYQGLQAAARASGRKVVLLQCGWTANDDIAAVFRDGAARVAGDLRCLFTEGRDDTARTDSWAAADLFISLSDNLQETFGLTPIEAMAAGLPVVVTDWDGYKDTVRDGIDGFRIPTWMPGPGAGQPLARGHELGLDSYDAYCGLTCQHVALDHAVLAERLTALVADGALRERLGAAGRQRAREMYDWRVVYGRYQHLWRELSRLRADAASRLGTSPRVAPGRMDPFAAFRSYPTRMIAPSTFVRLSPGATAAAYRDLAAQPLFAYAAAVLPPADAFERLRSALQTAPLTLAELAVQAGAGEAEVARWAAVLAKMGMLQLSPADA